MTKEEIKKEFIDTWREKPILGMTKKELIKALKEAGDFIQELFKEKSPKPRPIKEDRGIK